ncbi:MAG: hypothetical protein IJW30_00055 [Clostridia bacterium]|nr:hypothetical protein [Clostridia bacterium]
MTAPKRLRRLLCRAAYLLPLLLGVLFLVYTHVPHLWFVYDDPEQQGNFYITDTTSPAQLQKDAKESSFAVLDSDGETDADGEAQAVRNERSFATLLTVASVVYYVALVLFAIPATLTAICSLVAFALPPTHLYANRAKRLLHFLCPNRICFLLSFLFPILTALFPQVLLFGYQTYQGLDIRLHYQGLPDWALALALAILCAALFLLTLPWQAEEHLDMFRIYKSRDKVARRGEEVV